MNNKIAKFTKWITDLMVYGGVLVLVTLPASLRLAGRLLWPEYARHYAAMLAVFGAAGILGLLIVIHLRRMMRTVLREDCFVRENVISLNRMALASAGIAVIFVGKLLIVPTPASAVIVLVFFIAALFSEVLARVFDQAIRYKEENDLTI